MTSQIYSFTPKSIDVYYDANGNQQIGFIDGFIPEIPNVLNNADCLLKVNANGDNVEWTKDFNVVGMNQLYINQTNPITNPSIVFLDDADPTKLQTGIVSADYTNVIVSIDGTQTFTVDAQGSFISTDFEVVGNLQCDQNLNVDNGVCSAYSFQVSGVGTTSNPNICANNTNDPNPKTGINLSNNLIQLITEGNIASSISNGTILLYKPVSILYEINPLTSRTGTVTATNTDNKIQKLNFSSADCIYILPTGLNDGTFYQLMPFKTSGTFNCYLQVGSSVTITTMIGGVKTSYTTGNVQIYEGYIYNVVYQSSISQWYVWRSS